MALLAPLAGELVLDMEGAVGAGNIVNGAETLATTFKNEVVKGSIFGAAEGALFGAGEKLYKNVKKDLGIDKPPPKKRHRTRKIG
tara:strand:+ start:390 stop:644 length:255 start_codon:yes stop_codon:yes gene_type:complete